MFVSYLCIALFAELLDLSWCDVTIFIALSALIKSQATANSTFPRSWQKHLLYNFPLNTENIEHNQNDAY